MKHYIQLRDDKTPEAVFTLPDDVTPNEDWQEIGEVEKGALDNAAGRPGGLGRLKWEGGTLIINQPVIDAVDNAQRIAAIDRECRQRILSNLPETDEVSAVFRQIDMIARWIGITEIPVADRTEQELSELDEIRAFFSFVDQARAVSKTSKEAGTPPAEIRWPTGQSVAEIFPDAVTQK